MQSRFFSPCHNPPVIRIDASAPKSVRGLTIVELVVMAVVVAIHATTAFLIYRPVQVKVAYQAEGLRTTSGTCSSSPPRGARHCG